MKYLIRTALLLSSLQLIFSSRLLAEECSEATRLVSEALELSDGSSKEESLYKSAIEKCPSMPEAHYNLGIILEKKGRLDSALSNFKKANELRDSKKFKLAYAHALSKKGSFETAKSIYDELLKDKNSELEALVGMAHIQSLQGKPEDAVQKLFKAKDLDPNNTNVTYNLAVMLERLERFDESLVFYESTLEVDSEHQSSLVRAGLVSLKLDECTRGLKYLEKANEREPENLSVLRAIGVCYEKLNQYERAEISLKRALKLDPKDVNTSINLSIVLIKTDREALAEEVLLKVSESERTAKLHSALGWAQLELGKYKKAEESLRIALKELPADKTAKDNLLTLYKRTGRESSIPEVLSQLEVTEEVKKMKNR